MAARVYTQWNACHYSTKFKPKGLFEIFQHVHNSGPSIIGYTHSHDIRTPHYIECPWGWGRGFYNFTSGFKFYSKRSPPNQKKCLENNVVPGIPRGPLRLSASGEK